MATNIYMPYTYLIGWSKTNKYYYGSRYSQKIIGRLPEDDLWQHYFTSSSYVKDYILEHGQPDIISIRRRFSSAQACLNWEHKVLSKLRVLNNEKWLNQAISNKIATNSIEIRSKISKTKLLKKYEHTEEFKRVRSEKYSGLGNPNYGKTMTDETKAKISKANTGKITVHSPEAIEKMRAAALARFKNKENHPRFGKKNSEYQKQRITENNKIRIRQKS